MRHTRAELPKQLFVVQRSSRCVETALNEAYEDAPAHGRGVYWCLRVLERAVWSSFVEQAEINPYRCCNGSAHSPFEIAL
jgi:hypothetical protein